ncbi:MULTISPECIES: L,D-transpeptidase [unclassified Chelatococcus]|uniref:L,D-transpeptidase n=1 Tax=unclassified Chelatococcus TaxID=2638111 RepID=UPI001BCC0606|nr:MULTISPECIES: L,D-transpeptidase [unclassified Chelatococcus]MBS7696886.1 L,D-transpeptidase [Chelatococcus sp. YT9]MBX3555876.1 L,D-transpeptidase [Chelatococcus sp.]
MGGEISRPSGWTRRSVLVLPALGFPAGLLGLSADATAAPSLASMEGPPPGTVLVRTRERRLYLVLGGGQAIRYPVAVAKPGKQWHGAVRIDGKYVEPAWMPPPDVKRDNPRLPDYIAGGARDNPMGARALTLSGDLYAIHGTTRSMRRSIGTYASYGCIRMLNEDIIDLYQRVRVGTPVIVVP